MDTQGLRRIPLFQRLSDRGLDQVLSGAIVERYERGDAIFRQGERAESFWVVLEGWVHLVRASGDDAARAAVLFTITPAEVLCGISALESGVYQLSGVAASKCRVIRISGKRFAEVLEREPGFAAEALRLCTRRIQHIAQQYGSMAEPVPQRILRAILRLHQQFGSTLPVTHRELAQMAWTTTESAIRVVRKLKRRGYVTGTRGQLRLRNPKTLAHLVHRVDGRAGR